MSLSETLKDAKAANRDPNYFDLLELIKKNLNSDRTKSIPEADSIFRVSSVVYFCAREEVLKNRNKIVSSDPIDNKTQRTFDIGSAMHSWIQNEWFGKWGILWGNWLCHRCNTIHKLQKKPTCCDGSKIEYVELYLMNKDHGITGHVDSIIELPSGEKRIVEIKTCSSKQFQLVTAIRKTALDSHKDQVQLYMWLTGIKKAHVFYLEKDESQIWDYVYDYSESRVTEILNTVEAARKAMRDINEPLPERICKESSCARAKRCFVRKLCFN